MWMLLWQHGPDTAGLTDAAANAAGHGEDAGEAHFELWNVVTGISNATHNQAIEHWMNPIYSLFIMFCILLPFFWFVAQKMEKIPGRRQNFVEMIFGSLDNFITGMLGEKGRTYVPMLGTLFIYIFFMNLFGLVPGVGHSPTSNLNITLSLALFVFITVQIHGIRALGFLGYVKHFADLPLHRKPSGLEWGLAPLMFILHIIGEIAKPVSLSLRLFGNITGEDILIFIFVTMAMAYFIPLHFFMYPIVLIGSFAQALVFTLLSTVYIMLMSPHEEEH